MASNGIFGPKQTQLAEQRTRKDERKTSTMIKIVLHFLVSAIMQIEIFIAYRIIFFVRYYINIKAECFIETHQSFT